MYRGLVKYSKITGSFSESDRRDYFLIKDTKEMRKKKVVKNRGGYVVVVQVRCKVWFFLMGLHRLFKSIR